MVQFFLVRYHQYSLSCSTYLLKCSFGTCVWESINLPDSFFIFFCDDEFAWSSRIRVWPWGESINTPIRRIVSASSSWRYLRKDFQTLVLSESHRLCHVILDMHRCLVQLRQIGVSNIIVSRFDDVVIVAFASPFRVVSRSLLPAPTNGDTVSVPPPNGHCNRRSHDVCGSDSHGLPFLLGIDLQHFLTIPCGSCL